MSPHIYCTKAAELDEAAYAVLRNRELYIAASAATVGRMAAHPPVPRSKAMIPVSTVAGHSAPLTESDSPSACPAATFLDLCDDREPDLPCGYTAPTHYLEF
jgi:hypothetical protein